MAQIWQVRISNGKTHYFDNQVEAEFVSKDAVECGCGQLVPCRRDGGMRLCGSTAVTRVRV